MPTNVGAELASVPFGKMIYDMASAIARSQSALDQSSIALVRVLANTTFDYVPDVVETLTPSPRQVPQLAAALRPEAARWQPPWHGHLEPCHAPQETKLHTQRRTMSELTVCGRYIPWHVQWNKSGWLRGGQFWSVVLRRQTSAKWTCCVVWPATCKWSRPCCGR